MKKLLKRSHYAIYILLTAIFILVSCGDSVKENRYKVKQVIEPSIINTTQMQLKTRVWVDGEIIRSWYDDIDNVDSALVVYRQAQGDSMLVMAKACR